MGERRGWSTTGELHTGDSLKTVSLQVDFENSGPGANDYTIEFGFQGNTSDSLGNPIQTEALVTWSVQGNSVSRRVTVGNGVSLTGVGEACKVIIQDKTIDLGGGAPIGDSYKVSAQVAPGTRGTNEQPPTLVVLPPTALSPSGQWIVTTGGAVNVPVPLDAGVISVFVTVVSLNVSPNIPPETVIVSQNTGTVAMKQYDPREFDDWVPVAPGTTQITLNNNSGQTVAFSVTYGIDG